MTVYEEILEESLNYKGNMFWENYILSNLVKTFGNDYAEIGESAIEMYSYIYGDEIKPLLEEMIANEDYLYEAANIHTNLLFESIGELNILNEMNFGVTSYLKGAESTIAGKASGVLGFLKGLWSKLKDLGTKVFARITPFIKKGFGWAKNIVQKGVSWIASNPIARVAVPAVLIGGSLIGAIKLINKIRRKKNIKKISPDEEEKLRSVVDKNKNKIDTYAREAGVKLQLT